MKQGDHVKVIGRDGFYVFLKEVQGGAKSPDKTTLAVPVNQVISLEATEWARRFSPCGSVPIKVCFVGHPDAILLLRIPELFNSHAC